MSLQVWDRVEKWNGGMLVIKTELENIFPLIYRTILRAKKVLGARIINQINTENMRVYAWEEENEKN